jgi:PST family polysaccharide transporter
MRSRTLRGVAFTAGRGVLATIARIGTVAVLARVLSPADFGLVATVVFIQMLASMIVRDGLGDAVIQRQELSAKDTGTATTALLAISAAAFGVLWLTAPWIEALVGLDNLTPALRAIAVVLPIDGLARLFYAETSRRLRFERVAIIQLLAILFGNCGVSLALAFLGAGYWALIGGVIGDAVFRLIGFGLGSRAAFRPDFSLSSLRKLLGFSAPVTVWAVAGYCVGNIERLVLARFLGAEVVGYFSRARALLTIFIELYAMPVNQVLFPVLSRFQQDRQRLFKGYCDVIAVSTLIGIPGAVAIAAVADPLVGLLLGSQWDRTVPLVRILAISLPCYMLAYPFVATIRSIGEMREAVALTVAQATIMTLGCLLLYPYGTTAIAWLVVGNSIFGNLTALFILTRKLGASLGAIPRVVRTGALFGLIMAVTWLVLTQTAGISTDTLSGAVLYLVIVAIEFAVLFLVVPRWFLGPELIWTRNLVGQALGRLRRA